jgi:hypothetical protein
MHTPETLPYEPISNDWDVQQTYLHGDCWVLALALCERLELDEAFVLCDEEGDAVHCFAALEVEPLAGGLADNEVGIDIRGWRVIGEIVEEFFEDGLDHDFTIDRVPVDELRGRVDRNWNCSGLAGLPDAHRLIDQCLAGVKA